MGRGIPLKVALCALAFTVIASDYAMAQRGGRGGFGGGGSSALGLLARDEVKEELEVHGEQEEIIAELQQQQRAEVQEMFSGVREQFRDLNDEERQELIQEIRSGVEENNKKYEELVFEELLPHQVQRLRQLMARMESQRSGGVTRGAFSESMVEELGLTDEQIEEMKEIAADVQEDLKVKYAELKRQGEEKILAVLDPEQRAKYDEMMGDAFEFSQQNQFGRGGAQGGRGGPQGGRGGDRGGDRGGRGGGDRGGRRGGGGGGEDR